MDVVANNASTSTNKSPTQQYHNPFFQALYHPHQLNNAQFEQTDDEDYTKLSTPNNLAAPTKTNNVESFFELTEPTERTSTLDPEQAIRNLFPREFPKEFDDALDYLKHPPYYIDNNIEITNSFLFHGPSGTGKTYLVESLSHEYQLPFLKLVGSNFLDPYIGIGPQKVTAAFNIKDPQNRIVMLFIDEVDGVSTKKEKKKHQEYRAILTNLLAEIQNQRNNRKLFMIVATNDLNSLDESFTERFDDIEFKLPFPDERKNFFNNQLHNFVPVNRKEQLAIKLAQLTNGFSLRDLSFIFQRAKTHKFRMDGKEFTLEEKDFLSFIQRINGRKKNKRWQNIKEYPKIILPYATFLFNLWLHAQGRIDYRQSRADRAQDVTFRSHELDRSIANREQDLNTAEARWNHEQLQRQQDRTTNELNRAADLTERNQDRILAAANRKEDKSFANTNRWVNIVFSVCGLVAPAINIIKAFMKPDNQA